jgi:hypothetical protein
LFHGVVDQNLGFALLPEKSFTDTILLQIAAYEANIFNIHSVVVLVVACYFYQFDCFSSMPKLRQYVQKESKTKSTSLFEAAAQGGQAWSAEPSGSNLRNVTSQVRFS